MLATCPIRHFDITPWEKRTEHRIWWLRRPSGRIRAVDGEVRIQTLAYECIRFLPTFLLWSYAQSDAYECKTQTPDHLSCWRQYLQRLARYLSYHERNVRWNQPRKKNSLSYSLFQWILSVIRKYSLPKAPDLFLLVNRSVRLLEEGKETSCSDTMSVLQESRCSQARTAESWLA
jgi:hypothetical protein